MEPITLCGVIMVMFGLWDEFGATVKSMPKRIGICKPSTRASANLSTQKVVYRSRMPICLANGFTCQ